MRFSKRLPQLILLKNIISRHSYGYKQTLRSTFHSMSFYESGNNVGSCSLLKTNRCVTMTVKKNINTCSNVVLGSVFSVSPVKQQVFGE